MPSWEEQLAALLDAFLRLPSSSSCLPPPFRAALLQPEQPQALHANVPASLLSQALCLCSPEAACSCKEGLPAHPLCKQLARALCEWMNGSVFPRALELMPGLEDDHLEDKVKAWAEKIIQHLATLQELIQGVKLHLQVQEPLFSQLRERSLDTLFAMVGESSVTKHPSRIKTPNSFIQGDMLLLNKVLLHEVQIGCGSESCASSNKRKIFGSLVFVEDDSNGVLLGRSLCHEDTVNTVPAILMHCVPENKQPLKIVENILEVLNVEGVKSLLGFRSTIGSIRDALPPSRSLLLASFLEANGADVAGTKLTVGGRALAKHVHRSTSGWWGPFSGNDEKKNQLALNNITYLIEHACWMNVHYMPPNSFVFEVRVKEGYGARWTADGTKFRGFLEPQMMDGHAKKWRH